MGIFLWLGNVGRARSLTSQSCPLNMNSWNLPLTPHPRSRSSILNLQHGISAHHSGFFGGDYAHTPELTHGGDASVVVAAYGEIVPAYISTVGYERAVAAVDEWFR